MYTCIYIYIYIQVYTHKYTICNVVIICADGLYLIYKHEARGLQARRESNYKSHTCTYSPNYM